MIKVIDAARVKGKIIAIIESDFGFHFTLSEVRDEIKGFLIDNGHKVNLRVGISLELNMNSKLIAPNFTVVMSCR